MTPKVPGTEEKETTRPKSVPELVRSLERASMEVESVLEEVRRQSEPPPSSRPPRPAWRRGESQLLRVLVLSEDARTRRLRVTELLTAGFEVDWARDIEEALFRATCVSPDVIVLDGPRDPPLVRQLLDHLASFESTHRLPIILRSEFALPREVRDRCAAVVRGPEAGEQIVAFVQALAFLPRRRRERAR